MNVHIHSQRVVIGMLQNFRATVEGILYLSCTAGCVRVGRTKPSSHNILSSSFISKKVQWRGRRRGGWEC